MGAALHTQSINELKKNDLFDLGVVMCICATGGLDMVNEDQMAKLTDFSQHCCIIHALDAVDPSAPGFDTSLLSTLISLRKIFSRISPGAQDFICECMQQRFTEKEMQDRNLQVHKLTANHLLNCEWINSQEGQ